MSNDPFESDDRTQPGAASPAGPDFTLPEAEEPAPQRVAPSVTPTPSYPAPPQYGPAPYQPYQPYPPMSPYQAYPPFDDPDNPDAPRRGVGPIEAYRRFWSKGLTFSGRASLAEYWWAAVINAAVAYGPLTLAVGSLSESVSGTLVGLYMLAAFVPGIALLVRRLHDSANSGFLSLLMMVPFIGWLVVFILTLLPGRPEGARYDRRW